jgi:hypothetical protein
LAETRRLGFSEGRQAWETPFPRLQAAEAEGYFNYYFTAVKAVVLSNFPKVCGQRLMSDGRSNWFNLFETQYNP